MELSDSKIKKRFMLSQKKAFLIFPGVEPCTFRAKAGKKKLLYTNIKTFLFSQKKVFLIFLHFSYILFFWTLGVSITLVDVLQNWLNWFHFLFLEGGLLVILIDCMIFLPPFLGVTRMFMSTVPFLAKLDQ